LRLRFVNQVLEDEMAVTAALFVSKRLQAITAALFCLMAMQFVLASCTPDEVVPYPMGARVAITR
jgi:hypothetical protein